MHTTAYLHAPSNVWAIKQFDKPITRADYNERELFYLFFAENTVAVSYFANKQDMLNALNQFPNVDEYNVIAGYYQPAITEQFRRITNLTLSAPKKYDEPAKVYDLAAYRLAKQKEASYNGKVL